MSETSIPAGYRPAVRMDESLFPLICEVCGATVARTSVDLHSGWHERWDARQPVYGWANES